MTYNFYMNIGVYTCLFTRCVDHCNDDCTHEHNCGGEVTNKKQRKGLMHSFFLIALVSQCPFPVEMPPTTQKINEKQLLRSGKVIASTSCRNHTVAFKNCLFLKASLSGEAIFDCHMSIMSHLDRPPTSKTEMGWQVWIAQPQIGQLNSPNGTQ